MGSILYLTQFNQQVFGATPTESGLMLLPMIGGLMLTSIGTGQIISRTGRYKPFLLGGFILATIGMALLTTLNPTVSYGYEAFIIVLLGLGLGVAMPVLNLAVQNEFGQKDLGAATSSNQLFRSLGSTIGTAVFGALLTAGIVANIGGIKNTEYVQSLSGNAEISRIGSLDNANTLLTLNTPDISSQISAGAQEAFDKLPTPQAEQAAKQFQQNQQTFSDKVIQAFSDSLHVIFIVASGLMLTATVLIFFLKERRLKAASPDQTPGEL